MQNFAINTKVMTMYADGKMGLGQYWIAPTAKIDEELRKKSNTKYLISYDEKQKISIPHGNETFLQTTNF